VLIKSSFAQEGSADSLQLIRGTDEEEKADFIAKQIGYDSFSLVQHVYCVSAAFLKGFTGEGDRCE